MSEDNIERFLNNYFMKFLVYIRLHCGRVYVSLGECVQLSLIRINYIFEGCNIPSHTYEFLSYILYISYDLRQEVLICDSLCISLKCVYTDIGVITKVWLPIKEWNGCLLLVQISQSCLAMFDIPSKLSSFKV